MAGFYRKNNSKETKKNPEKNKQTNKEEKEKIEKLAKSFWKRKRKKNSNIVTNDVEIIQKMKNKSWFSIEKVILKCINPNKAGYF